MFQVFPQDQQFFIKIPLVKYLCFRFINLIKSLFCFEGFFSSKANNSDSKFWTSALDIGRVKDKEVFVGCPKLLVAGIPYGREDVASRVGVSP